MSEVKQKDANLNDVVSMLQKNQETLEEIATWVKIGNFANVKGILTSALKKPEERLVYHLSDGRSTRDINAMSDVSRGSISNYQNNWYRIGLMKTIGARGSDRFIKKFNLEDFGIEIPSTKTTTVVNKEENQNDTQKTEPPTVADTQGEVETHDQ